jgi:Holliday junction resolvasome RuvABC endonuclease subunit
MDRKNGRCRENVVRALGVRCAKDALDWAIVQGDSRGVATIIDSKRVAAPDGARGEQLAWVRKEVQELLQRHQPDEVVVRVAEPGGKGNSLPRAEVEGVVQEAVASTGVPCRRVVAVSLRSAFSARNSAQLQEALAAVPVVASTPKTRQEPVSAALVAIPS